MSSGEVRDVNVRKVMTEDLSSARRNLQTFIEFLPSDADTAIMDSVQRLLLEIRGLDKKVSLSETGGKYRWSDENPSTGKLRLKKLRSFDRKLAERSSLIVKATSILNDRVLDNDVEDPRMELNKLRKYVVDLRNDIEHRADIVKGVR